MPNSPISAIPPRTVLVATDFSDAATPALLFAARIARHCGAALHVLHAEHPLLVTAAENRGIDMVQETLEELERLIATTPLVADVSPQLHVVTGPPVDVILDVAHARHADLIVAGSRGISGAAKLVFGSTAEGILRRSDVSVFVVPPAWTPPRADTVDLAGTGPVIAGIDMTPSSIAAARGACSLAKVLGTSVELVHVVADLAVPARWHRHAAQAMAEQVAEARKQLEAVVRGLACAVPVEWTVETGTAADRLASMAGRAADRAPVLVLGKKAPGSGEGAPGATAYRVLSLASVPVLMVVE